MSHEHGWPEDAIHVGVGRLLAEYADVVTRHAWGELDELFLPDATVTIDTGAGDVLRLVGPMAVGEFIATSIARFDFFEMVPLNHVVRQDAEGVHGRFYIHELRQLADTGVRSDAFGLYEDRFAPGSDGRWRFASRRYRSLARGGDHLEIVGRAGA
jgi:hypothetical protein